jgi:hypothetical protein
MKRVIVVIMLLMSSNALAADLDSKSAAKYALYAMMASNA